MISKKEPLIRTYWVLDGVLMAGEYPALFDEGENRKTLRWMLDHGVNSFIDLTEQGEAGLKPYLGYLHEEAERLGVQVKYNRCPIPDMSTPEVDEMKHILAQIEDAIANGDTVYLHCYGGKGRTGTVVGCYLVNQGMSGEAALQRIAQLRGDLHNGLVRSPETEEQRELVRNWEAD